MPATGTTISSDTPPVRDGGALRRLGRRKVEEARFPLVPVHYGTVLGWMLCSGPYTGTSLVPYRKLPTTVITTAESSPAFPYSNLAYSTSIVTLEPKSHTFN